MKNIESKFLKYGTKFILTFCIFVALLSVLNFPKDLANYVWEFMAFSFLGGASILSASSITKEFAFMRRVGTHMIFTSISLLICFGLSKAEGHGFINGFILPWLTVISLFGSILLFSFALSELAIKLSKYIFYKK